MWAFKYLKEGVELKEAFRDILLRGGDTDTNACIIGGLIGAAHGFESIPDDWVEKVLSFEFNDKPCDR